MKKQLSLAITLLLLISESAIAADAIFITDRIEVEILSERFPQSSIVTTLSSGDMVTVLKNEGDYSEIQTRDNITGWVLSKYLSKGKPARIEYAQLSAKYNTLEQELVEAKNELRGMTELRKEAMVARKLNEDLQQAKQQISKLEKEIKTTASELSTATSNVVATETAIPKQPDVEIPTTPIMETSEPDHPRAGADGLPLIPFKIFLGALLVLFLLGAYSGYRILDYRIRKKHGGVRLY